MIKATLLSKDGQSTFLIGLSRENTRRLHDGQPIEVRVSEVDPRLPDLTVLLVAGETEDAIAEMIRGAVPGAWDGTA